MGCRLADLGRLSRAMDPVSFRRQPDPIRPHRAVRSRPDRERRSRSDTLEFIVRIVAIGGIAIDRDDLEAAAWGRLLFAADGCGKDGDLGAGGIERLHRLT